MNRTLRYDEETRELRVVLTDYWKGEHMHYEYRVVGDDGQPLRGERHRGWDGRQVGWNHARYYVEPNREYFGQPAIYFDTEQKPVVAEETACPRWTNRRRRCDVCRAEAARS